MDSRKVVRVSRTEFELDNGAVYPHPVPLEQVPSVAEFQETYDCWFRLFLEKGWINEPPVQEQEGQDHIERNKEPAKASRRKGKQLQATR